MLKGTQPADKRVVSIRGGALGVSTFESSVYAQFWREASKAVAMSRRGKVHLVSLVDIEVLRALHAESEGKGSAGKMPIAVVCRDYESLAGPMMKGIHRTDTGWLMGDMCLVKFFSELPGPEEGPVVAPRVVEVGEEVQLEMEQLEAAMKDRSLVVSGESGLKV
jgi:hypothetical protein